MFKVITGAKPGEQLQPATTRAVLNASIATIGAELREAVKVLPLLDQVQRNRLKLALCETVSAINTFEHP